MKHRSLLEFAVLVLSLWMIYINWQVTLHHRELHKVKLNRYESLRQELDASQRKQHELMEKAVGSYGGGTRRRKVSLGSRRSGLGEMTNEFHRVQEGMQGGTDVVVIVGVKFIMDRDFDIWYQTFTNARFEPYKSSKKKLQKGQHADWRILKCLDLFDGKSHCIEPKQLLDLKRYQRVSRLYGLRKTLWNKDRFCDTMNNALRGFEDENMLEFVFPCWMLPMDYNNLIKKAKTLKTSFILKPTDRGEGNGIVVMDSIRQLSNWKSKFPDNDEVVVQTYLNNPFLINQRKWDMRTYVLVTSIHPLRAYLYRDGLVRFASSVYDKNAKSGGKQTAFLTNTSVNKKNAAVDDLTWPFPKLYRWLRENDFDADMMFERIETAIARLLLSAEPSFVQQFKNLKKGFTCVNCYQLLGVDVIVDSDMIPRVIEVNGEPSMQLTGEINSHYDYTKKSMTRDLVNLVFGKHDAASELASDLMEIELEGLSVGYHPNCDDADDICLRQNDLEYLVEMKRESSMMGGFRNIYPRRNGDVLTKFIKHLKSKFPNDYSNTATPHIHQIATMLAKISKIRNDNQIDDPNYTP